MQTVACLDNRIEEFRKQGKKSKQVRRTDCAAVLGYGGMWWIPFGSIMRHCFVLGILIRDEIIFGVSDF